MIHFTSSICICMMPLSRFNDNVGGWISKLLGNIIRISVRIGIGMPLWSLRISLSKERVRRTATSPSHVGDAQKWQATESVMAISSGEGYCYQCAAITKALRIVSRYNRLGLPTSDILQETSSFD